MLTILEPLLYLSGEQDHSDAIQSLSVQSTFAEGHLSLNCHYFIFHLFSIYIMLYLNYFITLSHPTDVICILATYLCTLRFTLSGTSGATATAMQITWCAQPAHNSRLPAFESSCATDLQSKNPHWLGNISGKTQEVNRASYCGIG